MSEHMNAVESMNTDDSIKTQTKLFGLIAEHASLNRLFVMLNKEIKANNADDYFKTLITCIKEKEHSSLEY